MDAGAARTAETIKTILKRLPVGQNGPQEARNKKGPLGPEQEQKKTHAKGRAPGAEEPKSKKHGEQDGRRDPHINAGPQKEANSRISITGPTGPPVYSGQPWPATTLSMGFDGSDQSWSEDQRRTASVQTTTLNEEKKEQFHSAVADRQGNTCTTTTQAPTSITHTILEVEADIPTDGCKQMRNYKRPIRLADYIQEKCDSEMRPTRCYTIDFKAHSGTGLWSLLQFGYQATYRKELPKEAHYKESTLTALGQMVELGHNQPIRLEVYTDGSAGRGREGIFKASWAYVILIIHDKGTELLHWESGPVETDRQSRDWMGAPRATAETARRTAEGHNLADTPTGTMRDLAML